MYVSPFGIFVITLSQSLGFFLQILKKAFSCHSLSQVDNTCHMCPDFIIMQIFRKIIQLTKYNIVPSVVFTNPKITIKGIEQVQHVKNAYIMPV